MPQPLQQWFDIPKKNNATILLGQWHLPNNILSV